MKKILILISISLFANSSEFIVFKNIDLGKLTEKKFIDTKKDLEKNNMNYCYIEDYSILCLKGQETYASILDGQIINKRFFLNSPLIKLNRLEFKGLK